MNNFIIENLKKKTGFVLQLIAFMFCIFFYMEQGHSEVIDLNSKPNNSGYTTIYTTTCQGGYSPTSPYSKETNTITIEQCIETSQSQPICSTGNEKLAFKLTDIDYYTSIQYSCGDCLIPSGPKSIAGGNITVINEDGVSLQASASFELTSSGEGELKGTVYLDNYQFLGDEDLTVSIENFAIVNDDYTWSVSFAGEITIRVHILDNIDMNIFEPANNLELDVSSEASKNSNYTQEIKYTSNCGGCLSNVRYFIDNEELPSSNFTYKNYESGEYTVRIKAYDHCNSKQLPDQFHKITIINEKGYEELGRVACEPDNHIVRYIEEDNLITFNQCIEVTPPICIGYHKVAIDILFVDYLIDGCTDCPQPIDPRIEYGTVIFEDKEGNNLARDGKQNSLDLQIPTDITGGEMIGTIYLDEFYYLGSNEINITLNDFYLFDSINNQESVNLTGSIKLKINTSPAFSFEKPIADQVFYQEPTDPSHFDSSTNTFEIKFKDTNCLYCYEDVVFQVDTLTSFRQFNTGSLMVSDTIMYNYSQLYDGFHQLNLTGTDLCVIEGSDSTMSRSQPFSVVSDINDFTLVYGNCEGSVYFNNSSNYKGFYYYWYDSEGSVVSFGIDRDSLVLSKSDAYTLVINNPNINQNVLYKTTGFLFGPHSLTIFDMPNDSLFYYKDREPSLVRLPTSSTRSCYWEFNGSVILNNIIDLKDYNNENNTFSYFEKRDTDNCYKEKKVSVVIMPISSFLTIEGSVIGEDKSGGYFFKNSSEIIDEVYKSNIKYFEWFMDDSFIRKEIHNDYPKINQRAFTYQENLLLKLYLTLDSTGNELIYTDTIYTRGNDNL